MTFVHPLLLGGLVLIGLPVLIHLIMQQKPKRLPFPAFRFLLQKHLSNQRTLRLRHLLLLFLRMAIIALLCLALVRPKISGGAVLPALAGDRPVAAVLLVDTSPSMDYTVAGRSWFDEAKRRALEVLDELPEGSRIAILDSTEAGGEWSPSPSLARERLAGLRVRHANAPLTRQAEQAFRLLLDAERESEGDAIPKVVYFFSDRTRASWDDAAAKGLQRPDDVAAFFVDVGVDNAADVAVVEVKPERPAFWPGESALINVTVRAAAKDVETEVTCLFDGEPQGERRPLKLAAGRGEVLIFLRATAARGDAAGRGLAEGLHQVEVRLAGADALAFNNSGTATFRVVGGRRVLVLSDDPAADRDEWTRRLAVTFQPEIRSAIDAETLDLGAYSAVFLAHLAQPRDELWRQLERYVAGGGGLAVIPAGSGRPADVAAYTTAAARKVLPAQLLRTVDIKEEAERRFREFEIEPQRLALAPFLAPFRRWRDRGNVVYFVDDGQKPSAWRFWAVTPETDRTDVLLCYTDRAKSPALVERMVGRGRVLLLTTPLAPAEEKDRWNNYFGVGRFGVLLTNLVAGYLAGDAEEATLNYVAGQAVTLPLPPRPFFPRYILAGPGVVGADADLPRATEQTELRIGSAQTPGNFSVLDPEGRRLAAFSVAAHPDESDLDRVPVETIDATLGEGSVLPVGRTAGLGELLRRRSAQPVEAAPALLTLLLVALALECLLANRFYRQPRDLAESRRPEGDR